MLNAQHQILRTDSSGMPLEWIGYQDAVKLYYLEQVAYHCGSLLYKVRGGTNALSGLQSTMDIHSIIATHGNSRRLAKVRERYCPPLNNPALFRRDAHMCMYCGDQYSASNLSRDHVTPISKGGLDVWNNVVTACKRCNNHKAGWTPEQAGMQLIAVPFTPTHAEYIFLQGKRVLADQMQFLLTHFPRTSPLHKRVAALVS